MRLATMSYMFLTSVGHSCCIIDPCALVSPGSVQTEIREVLGERRSAQGSRVARGDIVIACDKEKLDVIAVGRKSRANVKAIENPRGN